MRTGVGHMWSLIIRKRLLTALAFLLVSTAGGSVDSPQFTGWAAIVKKNKNLNVLIRVEVTGKDPGYGSGAIVKPGYVITAKHVLPDKKVRDEGNYLISGLIGWDEPSIDFSHALKLDVVYVSNRYDLAILGYHTKVHTKQYAFTAALPQLGDALLVMGYPDGGSLTCTSGLASRKAEDGKFATDAAVGIANSGGPVFTTSGGLVGIILEGSGRKADGKIALGYFLTVEAIQGELSQLRGVRLTDTPPPAELVPEITAVTFAYSVNDEATEHLASPVQAKLERSFKPLDGFLFKAARFQNVSSNHVSSDPEVVISDGGTKAILRYTLTSGPKSDPWNAWISGSVITLQEPASQNAKKGDK